jgi:transcriptional regulator with XRE-family HTH domain
MNTLAERLKAARKDAGMSQGDLSVAAKCGQSTIASIERGRNSSSTLIPRLAQILRVEPLWLAEGRGPRRRDTTEALRAAEPTTTYGDTRTSRLVALFEGLPRSEQDELLAQLEGRKAYYDKLFTELSERRPSNTQ